MRIGMFVAAAVLIAGALFVSYRVAALKQLSDIGRSEIRRARESLVEPCGPRVATAPIPELKEIESPTYPNPPPVRVSYACSSVLRTANETIESADSNIRNYDTTFGPAVGGSVVAFLVGVGLIVMAQRRPA